ncbi:MAG: type II secretion system F family protein [Armatimonadota bacterium]|nr:type II secretion system F family protein [Armatimonadota bacterium]
MNPAVSSGPPIFLIALVWLGFLSCVGAWLSTRMFKNTLQRRLQQALTLTEEDIEDIVQEQQDVEMERSLVHRILSPTLKKMAGRTKATASGVAGQQIKDMLDQAGHPFGMYYAEFMALKTLSLVFMLGVGLASSMFAIPALLGLAGMPAGDVTSNLIFYAIWVLVFAFIGFSGPTFWLRRFVSQRLRQIRKGMADVVDLIVLSLEAGLGFDQAVDQAVQRTKGPLTDELHRVLEEVRVGKSQGEAFRDMATRVKMPDLSLLVAAIDQASKTGVGLAKALRIQGTEIRERRMAFVREQAGKLPVKMMLPLVLFIFPALFVVILGPAAVQFVEMSKNGQGIG